MNAPAQSPRRYLCWPGFEHNNWAIPRLLAAGCTPDIFFPGRNISGHYVWSFTSRAGYRLEIVTNYGTLVESDVERMINIARTYKSTRTWEPLEAAQ
jgi:hypothetical protein